MPKIQFKPILLTAARQMRKFLGWSIRDPTQADSQGRKVYEAPAVRERFLSQKVGVLRHPAGTRSYSMVSTSDADVTEIFNWLDLFPDAEHDFTYPPQLPQSSVGDWYTERTGQIAMANETPSHFGAVDDPFATPGEVIDYYRDLPKANPNIPFHHWRMNGAKPQFTDPENENIGDTLRNKHIAIQDAQVAAVADGEVQPIINNTTKIYPPEILTDRLAWHVDLMAEYRQLYGSKVKVGFNEWKVGESNETPTLDHLLAFAEMLLLCPRLEQLTDGAFDRFCFQQGAATGDWNLFYLDESSEWQTGTMLLVYEMFSRVMWDAQYWYGEWPDLPVLCRLEAFVARNKRYIGFSNKGTEDVEMVYDGGQINYIDSTLTVKTETWRGTIPARTCGIIIQNTNAIRT